jgi:VWFA-related protein
MNSPRILLLFVLLTVPLVAGQQPEQPRFRGTANLVRVDAYVTANGKPITGLTADDFEVFEDDKPQKIEAFQFVTARGPDAVAATKAPQPSSTRDMREAAQDPEARIFVLYLDIWHVGLDGSYRSSDPIAHMLEKVIGPNDLVGLMNPQITPQNMTLLRRGQGLDQVLRDSWAWGQRDRAVTVDPRESDIKGCYPGKDDIVKEMIERRRETATLDSINDTVSYLDGLRDERKFLVLLSEGWVLFRRNDQLARPLDGNPPAATPPVGVGIDGRVTTGNPREGGSSVFDWCERERVRLSYIDHELEVRELAQRANRANVSFYPLDPRGLVAFDDSIGPLRPASPIADSARLRLRQDGLRELADQTDGAAVLNTNNTGPALERILADTHSYYLMSYYSTNQKLDGRFRRISVKVKRPDVDVRARPGYLAPTEAEARAAGATTASAGARSAPPPAVTRALDAIVPGRGNLPMRVQATGLAGKIRAIVEIDPVALKQPEWQPGAAIQVTIETDRGGSPRTITQNLPGGQRSIVIEGPDDELPPGRYIVRVEAKPMGGSVPARASSDATVAAAGATIGLNGLAYRRGPTTGLAYQPTADPRFRRTERLRLETPIFASGPVTATARVLTREGQPLPLVVTVSERTDEPTGQRYVVVDTVLAPLAQGDFVLEIVGGKEVATYGFRIVP